MLLGKRKAEQQISIEFDPDTIKSVTEEPKKEIKDANQPSQAAELVQEF